LTYRETLQAVDTLKALKIVGIDGGQQGAYVYFPCTGCGKQAVIKAYGDKKNIWYCPECKDKGHIISLIDLAPLTRSRR
jgi:ribosomal protein L37AE/L43A